MDCRNAVYTDFWPAFRVDYLVDAIFGTANGPLIKDYLATQGITFDAFQLDSDFLTDNATHGFWDNIYYSDRSEESYSTTFGSNNYWGLFLPSQMTALDFFMKLVKTFNLVFDFDGITLKVEPRLEWTSWDGNTYDGFYGATTVDWSNKIAKEQSIEYSTTNYKRQVRISYGTDSYPFTPSIYPFFTDDKVNQPEVRYIVDLNNNLEEGVTDIKLPFNTSPSKFYQPRFDFVRQDPIREDPSATRTTQLSGAELDSDSITWTPDPNYSDRLFVFKAGAKPMGVKYFNDFLVSIDDGERQIYINDPRWRDWIYEKQDGTEVTNIGYPYVYNCMTVNPFANTDYTLLTQDPSTYEDGITSTPSQWDTIDNVDPVGPTTTFGTSSSTPMTGITPVDPDDINLGIYASNSVNMVDGLYERFWKSTLDHLVTTKTLVTKVRLTRNEFVTLDMSAYYTALGQRFILNAVKDYDPTLDEQMVEVELLSVDFVRASELVEGGENIVTDGLIFHVDAGNASSYSGTGTTWVDLVNGNNGTINNGAAYNSAQGGYFEFDGVDDQVDFGQPAILESFPMSIDLWFYSEANSDGLITKGTTRGASSTRDWDISGTGTFLGWFVSNGSSYPVNVKDTYPSLNAWHHLSVSWDGTTTTNGAKMYLDGALFAQGTASATTYTTLRNIFVGGNRAGFYFDGRISMVKMYDKVLSAAEALQNYNASKDRYGL